MINCTSVFQHFLSSKSQQQQDSLSLYEHDIINQAFANIGSEQREELTESEAQALLKELEDIVYLDGHLPCIIGRNNEDKLINPQHAQAESTTIEDIHAQNFLLHLGRGVPLSEQDNAHYEQSFLAHPDVIKHFFGQKNPHFMHALKRQIRLVFEKAGQQLQNGSWPEDNIKQYEVFQGNLLALYPFWEPEEGEEIRLPQKINGQWQLVNYQFKRFDISPKSGPLSWVIEDEDRMYSFALEPQEKNLGACSHLVLMGTIPYPTGQGNNLAKMYNCSPGDSVGEKHDMTEVNAWLSQQAPQSVLATGHSKGATMAILMAAQHPDKIVQADCLNPAMISNSTFKRLAPHWNALTPAERPCINIYAQKEDPIFLLEKNFLQGMHVYRVIPNTERQAVNVVGPLSIPIPGFIRKKGEAHAHFFAGRERALFLKINTQQERKMKIRALFSDVKSVFDCFYFPLGYTSLFLTIIDRKMNRFYMDYEPFFIASIICSSLLSGTILFFSGPLIPLVLVTCSQLGLILSTGLATGIAASLVLMSPMLSYFSLQLAYEITILAAKITHLLLMITSAVLAIIMGSTIFAINSGIDFLCSADNNSLEEETAVMAFQEEMSDDETEEALLEMTPS